MSHVVADRVLETTTTTGTGPLTLLGAVTGYQTFSAAPMVNGDTCEYCIEAVASNGVATGDWEGGLGTWGTGNILTRTLVTDSSSSGSAVSFGAGNKRAFMTRPASSFKSGMNVKEFGAVGDGVTDDSAAFVAAIAFLKASAINVSQNGYYKASPRLFVPAGNYYLGNTTLDITHTLIIEGEGQGHAGPALASILKWDNNATGIRIQAHNTSGASTVDGVAHFSGAGTILRGLALVGSSVDGIEEEYHGVHAKVRFTMEDCIVISFPGSGVHVHCTSLSGGADEGNANLFRIQNSTLLGCRDGLLTQGGDANAGSCINVDFSYNRRWGANEISFLGNTYVGCHTSGNGYGVAGTVNTWCTQGGYRYTVKDGQEAGASTNAPSGTDADNTWWYVIGGGGANAALNLNAWTTGLTWRAGGGYHSNNNNGFNVFTGCYSEGDQPPSQFVYPTIIIGGLHGAGVEGSGAYLRNISGNLTIDGLTTGDTTVSAVSLGPGAVTFNLATHYPTGGGFRFNNRNHLAFSYANSDESTNTAFEITTPGGTQGIPAHFMWFPRGAYFGGAGSYQLVAFGSAAPTTGTYSAGDIVFNQAPTVGEPFAWRCITSGTPGTWEAAYGGLSNLDPIGYSTGAGGAVTQATSRTTGVTLNKVCGAITLVSAAGTATWQSFTVTNSAVAATDTIIVSQKSGTDKNMIYVTAVAAGSFEISFATTGGTTTEQPVFNFAVLKAVAA